MKSNYRKTWHILHFILTVLFLPYCIIWIICTLSNNAYNRNLQHYEMLDMMGKMNHNIQNPPANQNKGSWTE